MLKRCLHVSAVVAKQIPRNLKGKSVTAQQWLTRQINDPYVKLAKAESYRCRSAFKLLEIVDRFHILQPGQTVVDCGAAPGSWCQVALRKVSSQGKEGAVIGIDLLRIQPIDGVILMSGKDFSSVDSHTELMQILDGRLVDVILSDMAPNATGVKTLDHEKIVDLCLTVLKFSLEVLSPGGTVLCKLWQGRKLEMLRSVFEKAFDSVKVIKPQASRSDSAELFILGRKFKGRSNILQSR